MYYPENFDENRTYKAILVAHPGGGVKEQAAGLYAKLLAEKGFVAIAYDASYQGESGGMPRGLNIQQNRAEDIHATVDYLTSLPYVDTDHIGALGICAGGGIVTAGATTDQRIKAVATVSAFVRYDRSWDGKEMTQAEKLAFLKQINDARTAEAKGAEPVYIQYVTPVTKDTPKDLADAYEYYTAERGYYPTADNKMLLSSMNANLNFNALEGTDTLLVQPILVIAGDKAGSLWQSRLIYDAAKSAKSRELYLIPGAGHVDMYDQMDYVNQAVDKIEKFYQATL